jgi:hypothetical protein
MAVFALSGRVQAIQALALSWLFTMISPGIAPEPTAALVWRYAVIASAAISTLFRSGLARGSMKVSADVLATLLLGAFLVLHATLFSPAPGVSILKAVSWSVSVSALLAAWGGLADDRRTILETQVFGGLTAVLVASVPLLASSVGYLRNGHGFQGILNHPQVFGVTMALLGAWLIGGLLRVKHPSWRRLTLLAICLVLVVLSESRTAGMAVVAAIIVALPTSIASARMPVRHLMPGLASKRMLVVVLTGAIGIIAAGPLLTQRLRGYVQKRGDAASVIAAYDRSRGSLINEMLANIGKHPLEGIGFGIASDPTSMVVDRDPVLGMPIGASVEKGVMPLAVLEETGIFGLMLVVGWLLLMLRSATRASVTASLVLWTALFTNMGESTFFSPGGMGLLVLVFVSWASTMRPRRQGEGIARG